MGTRLTSKETVLVATARGRWRRLWRREVPVVHEAAELFTLKRTLATLNPGILLLDVDLPGLGGVADLPALQRLSPSTKIVVLTSTPDDAEAIAALTAGARGYLSGDIAPSLCRKAVRVVERGEICIDHQLASRLLGNLTSLAEGTPDERAAKLHRLDDLSPRQREVARLIGQGASNREIASQLNISEHTVKRHLTAIYRRLDLRDRLSLALFAVGSDRRSGLLSTRPSDQGSSAPRGGGMESWTLLHK